MEPVSAIIGIASGAAGLVALTGQVVTYLVGFRDSYQTAELTILDLTSSCQAYRTAWSCIEQWASQNHDHTRWQDNASTLSELTNCLELGKIIMNSIQDDIDRLISKPSIWRRADPRRRSRDVFRLLLHEKGVLEHSARVHRQNTSLNLLISILTLPSTPLQEAAIEILRPKLRKDEQTAWTIVNTKTSPESWRRKQTLMSSSGSLNSYVSVDHPCNGHGVFNQGFSFEDDLFSGPVYKRLLMSKLCEQPLNDVVSRKPCKASRNPETVREHNRLERTAPTRSHLNSQYRQQIGKASTMATTEHVVGCSTHLDLHESDTLALELRQQGVFSRSVHEDFCEFSECHRPRKMPKRHLPLASVMIQNRISADEQSYLNDQFQEAIRRCDLASAAKALDTGADINCFRSEQTALEFCVQSWQETKAIEPDLPSQYTTIAEFLMLYKETSVPYVFGCQTTILHLSTHIGATAEFMEPFLAIEGGQEALCRLDKYGRSPLHVAVLASASGLFALTQLQRLYGANSIKTDLIPHVGGLDVLEFAISRKAYEHLLILVDMAKGHQEKEGNQDTNVTKTQDHVFVTDLEPHSVEQSDG